MRNPESLEIIDENIDIDMAFKKAQKISERDAIRLEDFEDLYGEEGIKQDQGKVTEMEIIFTKEANLEQERINKLSTIFETIIYEHIELSEWLGPNAYTIKSSRFDDIENGVDSIVEFRESEHAASHLALEIDVTFSSDLENKFERIRKEIKNGKLTKVRYFQSEFLSIRGELAKIPRVIIGADFKTVKELSGLWLEGDNKELGVHPIQFQILEEILSQARTFKDYANKVNQSEIASKYENIEKIVKLIYTQKRKSLIDPKKRDSVFDAIEHNLKYFQN